MVCISALPPYAFAPARAMCKQIRELFPKLKVVVCVWGFSGDTQKAMARFERTQPDRLSTSLAEAVEHIQELVAPKPEVAPRSRKRRRSLGRWQSEIECRSRAGGRLHPHSPAMPLDGLLAKCQSQPVSGMFFSVQALEGSKIRSWNAGSMPGPLSATEKTQSRSTRSDEM